MLFGRGLYDQYVVPVLIYGTETWIITKQTMNKLKTTQRARNDRC